MIDEINLLNIRIFCHIFNEYSKLSKQLQLATREMVEIVESLKTDDDEKMMALHTLYEVFFPIFNEDSRLSEPLRTITKEIADS